MFPAGGGKTTNRLHKVNGDPTDARKPVLHRPPLRILDLPTGRRIRSLLSTPEVLPQVLLVMASISHAAGVSQKGRPGTGTLLDGPYPQWDYEAALVPMASSSRRQMSWTPVTVFCSISAETTLFPSRSPKTTLSVRVPDS